MTKDDLVVNKKFYGRTMPDSMTPVMAAAPGEIDTLEVAKGDEVDEDDVIATLNRADGRGTIDIVAPADGEITSLDIQEGQMASNTEPVAMITDLSTVAIQVSITSDNIDLFNENETATVTFDGLEVEETADIDYVSSVANETGLYTVDVSLENDNNSVKPGMVAVVHLPENTVKDALIIPTTALVEQTDQTFVYTVQGDKAVKVDVTVLESQTNLTAIEADLSEGDTVITDGHITLSDGKKVNVKKEANES